MEDRLIVTASPHIDASTTRGLMGNVVIALLPAVLARGSDLRRAGAGAGRCDHPQRNDVWYIYEKLLKKSNTVATCPPLSPASFWR